MWFKYRRFRKEYRWNPLVGMSWGSAVDTPTTLRHLPALDGLRGVAILMVVGFHFPLGWSGTGFYGVTVFFALSGFLITTLLINEWEKSSTIGVRRFYARRAYRLWPALLAVTAAYAVVKPILSSGQGAVKALGNAIVGATYMENLSLSLKVTRGGDIAHLWSLAMEQQFYLVWPLVLLVFRRRGASWRQLGIGALAGFVVSGALRGAAFAPNNFAHAQFGPETRVGEILIGCALALFIVEVRGIVTAATRRTLRLAGNVALAALVAHFVFPLHNKLDQINSAYTYGLGFSLVALATAVLITAACLAPGAWWQRTLEIPVMQWLGRISYGLFLWHLPIFRLTAAQLDMSGAPLRVLQLVLSLAAAEASYRYIEQPFLRRRERKVATPVATAAVLPRRAWWDVAPIG